MHLKVCICLLVSAFANTQRNTYLAVEPMELRLPHQEVQAFGTSPDPANQKKTDPWISIIYIELI